ncbi:MAG: hypothetical protein EAX81_05825 [Candidatus Thorarchaeota archaeon]|nr:hypothetical protein [Candidatus Thorarchaeota archaeon]
MKKVLLGSLIAAGRKGITPEQYQLHSAISLLQDDIEDSSSIEDDQGYSYRPYIKGTYSDELQKDLDLLGILGGVNVLEGSRIYDPVVPFIEDLYAESVRDERQRNEEQERISKIIVPLLEMSIDSLFDKAYTSLNDLLGRRFDVGA